MPANLAGGQRAIVRSTTSPHLRRAALRICGQRKCVAHRPIESKNNKSKRQFDCFESTALRPGPSPPRPSARTAATPVAAFGIYPGRRSHPRGLKLRRPKSAAAGLIVGRAPPRRSKRMTRFCCGLATLHNFLTEARTFGLSDTLVPLRLSSLWRVTCFGGAAVAAEDFSCQQSPLWMMIEIF